MTKTITSMGFSSAHIERLREKLSEWGNPSDADERGDGFVDLWFVDADVFSAYIDSASRDYLVQWPSLYALGRPEDTPQRGTQIDEDTKSLIDSTAMAVSYFLFGRFRETLRVQSRRFLLTPEHSRELDAMAIAVSFEAQRDIPGMMSSLTAHYLALANVDDIADSSSHIDKIFSLLRAGSPSSKVFRALDLRQRLLNTMQDTAFFPSDEPGAAFAFQSTNRSFERRVKVLAREAFDIFLDSLIKLHPDVKRYAAIKEAVFAFHAPNRRLREYVDKVLFQAREQSGVGDRKSQQRLNEFDAQTLSDQARIAAREVSDVYALARLVTLAEVLNEKHPQGAHKWRVNLLTGSNMLRALRKPWRQRNAAVGLVRLVHPLSAMGIDGFAQPDEGLSNPGSSEYQEVSGEYALRALKQENSGDINVEEFLADFKRLLSSIMVSCAPNRERWMRNLRIKLGGLNQYDKGVYLRSVQGAISRDYVSTFAQLNVILPTERGQLPRVSLPALALPLDMQDPSPAQVFIMQLHREPKCSRLAPPVSGLIKADSTGYSALLCVGLGYLAQGWSWLRLAEAVTNTAVAFASAPVSEHDVDAPYPEGNEALFLAAFVSRMKVDGSAKMRARANKWLQHHRDLLSRAFVILKEWERTVVGQRSIAKSTNERGGGVTLAQLVRVRYETEQLAADVFGHMIDRLEIAVPKLLDKPPTECLAIAKGLESRWSELNTLDLQPQYCADVTFIGAQLVSSTIQAWLCVLADDAAALRAERDGHKNDHEEWITKWVKTKGLSKAAPGSMLVRVLVEIFNSRTRGVKLKNSKIREAKNHLDQMQFAALDEQRGPFFTRLLDHPKSPVADLFRSQLANSRFTAP